MAFGTCVMLTAPDVSVVIPVHNGEKYLAEAICSVLAQSHPRTEVIVVDDGSTDNSATTALAFGPPVRLVQQANLGPAEARNAGVRQAVGDMLAFLDADDLWAPDKLARQIKALHSNPTCEAVVGRVENFLSPELDEMQRRSLMIAVQQGGDVHVGALLIRRVAFERVGYFNVRWRQCDFVDWWGRATQAGLSYAILPGLVLKRRLHGNNLTRLERTSRNEYVAMLHQHLTRQRMVAKSAEGDT